MTVAKPKPTTTLADFAAEKAKKTCWLCGIQERIEIEEARAATPTAITYRIVCQWLNEERGYDGAATKSKVEGHFRNGHARSVAVPVAG